MRWARPLPICHLCARDALSVRFTLMDAREEVIDLVTSDDVSERIAELDEAHAKELLAVTLELLRDAQEALALNLDRGPFGPSGFF